MTILMADAAESTALRGAKVKAIGSYVDGDIGDQPNHAKVVAAYPDLEHLSIALFAEHDADCLDIEGGAARPSQAPGWVARQHARGIARPALYANVSTMTLAVLPVLAQAGTKRGSVRLWSAHYDLAHGEHICGPASCKWPGLTVAMDGTQWTDAYRTPAGIVDMSTLLDNFFGTTPPARSITMEVPVQLPAVKQGDKGAVVRTVQGLCAARGHNPGIDGDYGQKTRDAVEAVQRAAGFTGGQVDGIVGVKTWPALLGL